MSIFETRLLEPFGVEILDDIDRDFSRDEMAAFRKLFFDQGLVLVP